MSNETKNEVLKLLSQFSLFPGLGITAADIAEIEGEGDSRVVTLTWGAPLSDEKLRQWTSTLSETLASADLPAAINIKREIASAQAVNSQNAVPGVKNIIAVASGKGGVGKSTTAVNIALALSRLGATAGILDADVYGPSQPKMLGVEAKRPTMASAERMQPIEALGLQMISMGNLVTENTPMVWRGPMVSGALQQLLRNTHWQDVDYLIVDMPPGTGDIQLTLAQTVPVSGSVIVTTPQDIALLDAIKGIEMFKKVNIPVFGVVENMALHLCSNCGHAEAIFGSEGGERLARDYDVDLLGRLPLKMSIREQTDSGAPPVAAEPQSDVSEIYFKIAEALAQKCWQHALEAQAAPTIEFTDE